MYPFHAIHTTINPAILWRKKQKIPSNHLMTSLGRSELRAAFINQSGREERAGGIEEEDEGVREGRGREREERERERE